jgi:hypothetical protein
VGLNSVTSLSGIAGKDLDWGLDLLPIYKRTTRDYNLQISHTLASVLSLLQSPLAVFWQRILTQELTVLIELHIKSSIHSRTLN